MADTTLSFNVLAKDNATRTVGKIGQSFGNLHTSVGKVTTGLMAVGPALAGLVVGAGIKQFVQDARESAKIGRLTAQVIKSTGGAAKITADQVGDLATAISNKTGADDEAIQSGQNLLLTFTNIRNGVGKGNDIFNQASQAITDMTAAMNNGEVTADGMKTSSIQLGKALNDPIKGVTALQKVGVSFTASQKTQIKTLVDSGKTMEAQKIILAELGKEFGGAAEAAADPLTKLKTIAGNLSEQIGGYLLPIVDKAATWLGKILPIAVDKAGKFFRANLLPPLQTIVSFVKDKVIPVASNIVTKFTGLGKNIVKAIGKVDLGKIADDIWTDASTWAEKLIGGLKSGLDKGNWKPLGAAVGDGLAAALDGITTVKTKILDAFGRWIDAVDWGKLGGKVSSSFLGLIRSIDWGKLGGAIGDALIKMLQESKDLSKKVGTAFKLFMDSVNWEQVGHDSTKAIGRFISGIDWKQLAKTLGVAVLGSLKISKTVYDSVTSSAGDLAIGMFKSIIAEMGKFRPWLIAKTKELGGWLWSGLKSGLAAGAKGIGGFLKSVIVDPVVGWVKSMFGIRSPSTVFASIGAQLIAGLKGGIAAAVRGIGSWISRTVISPVVGAFGKAGTWLVQQGKNLVAGFKNGISAIGRTIGSWVYASVIQPAVRVFTPAGTWLVAHGRNLITGLKRGILAVGAGIGGWANANIINPLVRPFAGSITWLAQEGRNVIWGFRTGMVAVWSSVTKWVGGIATWIKDHKGPVSLDGRLLIPAGQAIMSGFLKGLKSGSGPAWNFVKSVGGKTVSALQASIGGPFMGGGKAPTDVSGVKAVVRTLAAQRGWGSGGEWDALYNLIMGESGFNPNAKNPTSSAYGLFQFLDSTWGSVGASRTSDPWGQTAAGLKYIAGSYGDPISAYSKWSARSPHWYEKGTPWVPNDQLAYVHEGEAIVPRKVNEARMRSNGGAQTVVLEFRSDGSPHMEFLVREFRKYIRVNGGDVQAVLGR